MDVSDPSPIKWDLHLLSSSPCIDSGTSEGAPDSDIDGNSRPQGSGYDIGAYEYGGTSPLVANFSATPTTGAVPLTVNFTDQSTGTVESWNWSFGDSSNSNEQNPSHTYNDTGSYTVTLTVTGPEGSDAETIPDYIKVTYPSEVKAMPWIPLLLLDEDNKLPQPSSCGEGLPLTLSDLSFPGTVTRGSYYDGSVNYQGTYEDITNPKMLSRIPYTGGHTTSVPALAPTVSNCSINFSSHIPDNLLGTGTIYFKLIDYDDTFDTSYNWDNNAVSNELSQPITIQ